MDDIVRLLATSSIPELAEAIRLKEVSPDATISCALACFPLEPALGCAMARSRGSPAATDFRAGGVHG
jgi:hypothetical protein